MSANGILLSLFILLIFADAKEAISSHVNGSEPAMVPMIDKDMVEILSLNDTIRRRLGSFQVCALCTCCSGDWPKRICVPSPCCYFINCNIPNRPFGYCSFIPNACNCFHCQT